MKPVGLDDGEEGPEEDPVEEEDAGQGKIHADGSFERPDDLPFEPASAGSVGPAGSGAGVGLVFIAGFFLLLALFVATCSGAI